MSNEEMKAVLRGVRNKMQITKVVCTRSVKGKFGDSYVGFSAAWDTVQDDAGGGADLISAQGGDVQVAVHTSGMTLKEARLAALVLGMQADIAAHDHAMAGGNITQDQRNAAVRAIKHNYSKLMMDELGGEEVSDES